MHVPCLIGRPLHAGQGDITGAAHVYLASEKRLLSASVTLHVRIHTWIPICTDTHTLTRACAQRGSFELARAHAPLPVRGPVEGHAFVSRCQDAGVCSCASRSIRFIFFSRGCPFVCGPVSFHPTPAPLPTTTTTKHHLRGQQRVCCVSDTLALFIPKNTILLFTADASSRPDTPKTTPARPAEGCLTKAVKAFFFKQENLLRSIADCCTFSGSQQQGENSLPAGRVHAAFSFL